DADAGLLAAGQVADGDLELLRPEEQLLRPGDDMNGAVAVGDGVAAGAEGLAQGDRRVEGRPALLEPHDAQPVGPGQGAGVGGALAGQDAQQGALAAAVGPEQTEPGAGPQGQVEAREEGLAAEGLGDPRRREQLARLPAGGDEVDARSAGGVAVLQLLQL